MATNGTLINIKAIYAYGFMAVVMTLPWSYHVCAYAIIFTCLLGLFSSSLAYKINRLKDDPGMLAFAIFYFLYVIGFIYSTDTQAGVKGLEQKIFLLGLPLIAVTSSQLSPNHLKKILLIFVFSNFALTLAIIGSAIVDLANGTLIANNFNIDSQINFLSTQEGNIPWERFSYATLTKGIIDPTYLSIFLVFSVSILIQFETGLPAFARWILTGWFFITIILLASRIGIILLGIISIYFMASRQQNKIKLIGTSIIVIAIILIVSALSPVTRYRLIYEPLTTPFEFSSDSIDWNSTNLRLLEWRSGIKGIQSAGLLGTGTGATWPVIQQYTSSYKVDVFPGPFNIHNQYLETFLEIGIAGFVALMACYVIPLRSALRRKNNLLLILMIIVAVTSLTESILERAHGLIFFTTLAPLLMYSQPYVADSTK